MWLYLVLLAAPIAAALASRLPRRPAAWLWIGIFAALLLFVGFRRHVGCDWNNYLLFLHRADVMPFWQALTLSDWGYMLVNMAAAKAGLGLWAVFVVCASLLLAGLLLVARREPYPALALIVATPVLIMIVAMGPVRQSAAIGLLLLSVAAYQGGRRKTGDLALLAAPLFHWTAFLLLPLMLLMRMTRPVATWKMAASGLVLGALAAAAHWTIPGFAGGPDAQGAWLRQMPSLLAVLAALWLSSRGNRPPEEEKLFGFFTALALVAIVCGFASNVTMDRLAFLSLPLQLMAIPRAVATLPGIALKLGWAAAATFYLVLFGGWLTFTTQTECFIPYRSYLLDTEYLIRTEPEPFWLGEDLGGYHPSMDHPRR